MSEKYDNSTYDSIFMHVIPTLKNPIIKYDVRECRIVPMSDQEYWVGYDEQDEKAFAGDLGQRLVWAGKGHESDEIANDAEYGEKWDNKYVEFACDI